MRKTEGEECVEYYTKFLAKRQYTDTYKITNKENIPLI